MKAFAVLSLILAFGASGTAHAQAACGWLGDARHHYDLNQASQVKGTVLGLASGIKKTALLTKATSAAYIDSLPIGTKNQLTVGMWIKPTYFANAESRLISQARSLNNAGHDFMVSTSNKTGLRFRLRLANTTQVLISRNGLLKSGQWNHVAVSYSGSQMKIFHNGSEVASKDVRGAVTIRSSKTGIGNQPPGAGNRPFAGAIDELVVFDSALSAGKVAVLASDRGLECSARFSESAGNTVSTAPAVTVAAAAPRTVVQSAQKVAAPTVTKAAPVNNAYSTRLTKNLPVYTGKNWPSSNQKLPMGGVFYGNTKAGMMSGNGPISIQNSIRFRAQRTGPIKAVRYNNRILRQTDIDNRCKIYGKGSVWCNCKDAGLDTLSCGYTLPNSYSVGNGGLITIEIRDDDNSAQNLPGSRVLATSAAFIPTNQPRKFPTIKLRKNATLEAGKIYHIVFRNDRPPTKCAIRNVPVAKAKGCERNRGAIGVNGTQHATDPTSLRPYGPFLGSKGSGLLVKSSKNARWGTREGVVGFYEVQYTDGTYVGETYGGYDNPNYNYGRKTKGTRDIDGANMAQQVFTVRDANRNVNGLWLNYGHSFLKRTNGANMKVTLKSGNTVLATGTIKASKECSNIAVAAGKKKTREKRDDWMCRTWGYTNLSKAVNLIAGRKYSVEFSAPAGAAYVLSSYFSYHGLDELNIWDDASAQHSTNSGKNWNEWSSGRYMMHRDLPVVFTLVGMPKQLP